MKTAGKIKTPIIAHKMKEITFGRTSQIALHISPQTVHSSVNKEENVSMVVFFVA
jgi:hypothetical protein